MSKYRSNMDDAIISARFYISCEFNQLFREWNDKDINDDNFRVYCLNFADMIIDDANDVKTLARKRD